MQILSKTPWRKPPHAPTGLRIYVVGDVHGHADSLRDVFARIDADMAKSGAVRPVQIFLGDYVDRGPASHEVLDLLSERNQRHEVMLLRGNHESMFLEFFDNPERLEFWGRNGGLQTLLSYGLKPSLKPSPEEQRELAENLAIRVPRTHRRMIASMPTSFVCGDFFFVHAGVRPGVPLKQQKDEDLLWIRDEFLLHERDFEKIIVHGHTPVPKPDIRTNRINLDVGAYATGRLACMVIQDSMVGFI